LRLGEQGETDSFPLVFAIIERILNDATKAHARS
jgi:hypothetical protein